MAINIWDVMTFYGDKRNDLVMSDVYADVGNFTTPDLPIGRYDFSMSFTTLFDRNNFKEFFRFSTDGGLNWNEFASTTSSKIDAKAYTYNFTKENYSGVTHMIVQARKETGAGDMTVQFSDCSIKRVGR